MDKKIEILSKLIENRNIGLKQSSLGKSDKIKNLLNQLLKEGLIKKEKAKKGRGEIIFITEKGEIEFIKCIEKDEFQEYLKNSINQIQDEIKKLNNNIEILIKFLSLKEDSISKLEQKIDLESEIYKTYKDLSSKEYSYLGGLVPIPSIVAKLIQKFNFNTKDIHKAIYDLNLKGELILEYGDKKEGNLIAPDGKSYYYLKFKK